MIRRVIDFVKDEEFEFKMNDKYITVINYSNIDYMEDSKISVRYSNGRIIIKGKKMTVLKLLNNEVLIKGDFDSIEVEKKYE